MLNTNKIFKNILLINGNAMPSEIGITLSKLYEYFNSWLFNIEKNASLFVICQRIFELNPIITYH
ncbi:MAG: hypothetical protein M0Q12_08310 [Synergistaceae bacterium]|nr:hypothetical protein [Synergistaceae bacterium]